MVGKLTASLGVILLVLGLLLLSFRPVLRLLSVAQSASPTPSALTVRPTPSPTPTVVPLGLRGSIIFGASVFRNDRGFYIPTVRSTFRFPSSIGWMAYLSRPIRRASLLLDIVRFEPGVRVISHKVFRIGEDPVRVMPYIISPDEWQTDGLTRPGLYGIRYSMGARELAEGILRLT